MKAKRASAYLTSALLIFSILTSPTILAEEATPETLLITVYPDGFTSIDYNLNTNSTFPTYNITIFGQVLENLIITDANGLPLGYALNNSVLTVYSLGTTEISITYYTQDLTSKQGRYWTVSLDTPINTRLIFPEETVIISLNKVPEIIETTDYKVALVMDEGLIQVIYVSGVVGTKEYAQLVINEAEQTINEIQSFGIKITQAETKFQQAEEAFNLGNYAEAESLSNEAKDMAAQIYQTAIQAQSKITEAEAAMAKAENEKRTLGLSDAQIFLQQAKNEYDTGNYSEAVSLATQALNKAEETERNDVENSLFFQLLTASLISAIIVISFLFIRSKKKIKSKKIRKIDVERIFRHHKELMPDEKQAIQFLIENNGEAFEAELYDYVKLPRTTTWRMVKRLKRMDIITVTKFRRQNLVRLKTKYDIKE